MTYFRKDTAVSTLRKIAVSAGFLAVAIPQASLAADMVSVETVFDQRGQVLRKSMPHNPGEAVRWTEFRYDSLDRLISKANPDGSSTATRYLPGDAFTAVEVEDENGHRQLTHFDEFGNEIYRDRFDGTTRMRTIYQYDVLDRLTGITDPLGSTWAYTYDGHGNKISVVDPDLGCRQMAYDAAGRLTEQRAADGSLITYAYDELNRVVLKTVDKDALQFSTCSGDSAPTNRSPLANGDGAGSIAPGTPVVIDVLANDIDPDGDALSVTEIDGTPVQPGGEVAAADGIVTLNQDMTLTYQSGPETEGYETFTYTVFDGGLASTGIVSFTIDRTNVAPVVAIAIPDQVATIDTAWTYVVPQDTFFDEDGDALGYSATRVDGSDLPEWLSFDENGRTFSGTPLSSSASLSIKVTASDGQAHVEDIFSLTLESANTAPVVANAIEDQTSPQDTAWSFTVPENTFFDADGDVLSYSATLGDGGALPAEWNFDGTTRTFTGTPAAGFTGTVSFKVIASDETASAEVVFDLVIEPATGVTGRTIRKVSGGSDWYNGMASSVESFAGAGYIQSTVVDPSHSIDIGISPTGSQLDSSIDFYIWLKDGTEVLIRESGDFVATFGAYAAGDTYAIERLGDGSLRYLKNGSVFYTSSATIDPSVRLHAHMSLYEEGAELTDTMISSGGSAPELVSWDLSSNVIVVNEGANTAPVVANAIADQTSPQDTAWSFTVPENTFFDADGDVLSYSATLADGSALPPVLSFDAATRTFTGMPPEGFTGMVSLKVIASDETASAEDVFDLVIEPAGSVTGRTIRKISGGSDWYNGMASSVESFAGAGYIQSTVVDPSHSIDIGISPTGSQLDSSIDFYIWLKDGTEVLIRENGDFVATFGAYAAGDTYAIERLGDGSLRYLKNGAVFYTSSATIDPSVTLHAHMSLYEEGAELTDTMISSGGSTPELVSWDLSSNVIAVDE